MNQIILDTLRPETALEGRIISDPEVMEGMWWGEPRYGHPEGKVYLHVRDVLDNIDRLEGFEEYRAQLRLIALTHDTFKYIEDKSPPRDWSKHHSMLARKFSEQYIEDAHTLDVIELHDEAFHSWRNYVLQNNAERGMERLYNLLWRVHECKQLYYLFFACDTRTGDKTQAPVRWFEQMVPDIKPVLL